MPTIGRLKVVPAVEPTSVASPKVQMRPSACTACIDVSPSCSWPRSAPAGKAPVRTTTALAVGWVVSAEATVGVVGEQPAEVPTPGTGADVNRIGPLAVKLVASISSAV